jgi:hypothetical protein
MMLSEVSGSAAPSFVGASLGMAIKSPSLVILTVGCGTPAA